MRSCYVIIEDNVTSGLILKLERVLNFKKTKKERFRGYFAVNMKFAKICTFKLVLKQFSAFFSENQRTNLHTQPASLNPNPTLMCSINIDSYILVPNELRQLKNYYVMENWNKFTTWKKKNACGCSNWYLNTHINSTIVRFWDIYFSKTVSL